MLGRLARILGRRFVVRPVALSSRVLQLHPVIEQACRAAVPADAPLSLRSDRGQPAAARPAARTAAQAGVAA